MNIKYRVTPNSGMIHTSSPRGGFAVYATPSPLGRGYVVRSGGPVIATPSPPVVVTFSSDSTVTETVTGYHNGRSRDFRVTRSATGKSSTSAQRAKAKADQLAYNLASNEASRQARAWEAYERDAGRGPGVRVVHQPGVVIGSGVVHQPGVVIRPKVVYGNTPAVGIAPNGKVIPVYGTGRPGRWVGNL